MKDLGARSVTAVFWGGGGALFRIALQLVTQIALARMLGPSQYGIFAIGAIVISFSNFFSDIGIAYGLIQKKEVTENDLRFVFTWQVILGSTVTLAIAYFSGEIAKFLGDINSKDIISALAIVCLLNALAAPSNNILKRNLNARSIQVAQIAGYIGGYILIGLPLAFLGMQVWALVLAWIVQALITLVLLYTAAKHSLRPLLWYPDARSLSKYGGIVFITNVTNWFIGNIDRVIIARFLSSRDVGLYATSYNVLQNPTSALLGVLQPIFFSASSRVSDEKVKITNAYYALVAALAFFILPAFATVAIISETFISAVYGLAWLDAATVFRPLALAMPFFLLWGLTTPLLWTVGSPIREFKAQLPIALLWVGVSWMAAHHSMDMVGWAVCGMFGLRCVVVTYMAAKTLDISVTRLWSSTRGGLFITIICTSSAAGIDWLFRHIGSSNPLMHLVTIFIATTILFLITIINTPRIISTELGEIINRVADRLPPRISIKLRTLTAAGLNHDTR